MAMEAQEQPGEAELRHLQQEEESRRDDVFLKANQEVSVTLVPSTKVNGILPSDSEPLEKISSVRKSSS